MNNKFIQSTVKYTLVISLLFLFAGCSDLVSGYGHMLYGLYRLFIFMLKVVGVLFIIALILSFFNG